MSQDLHADDAWASLAQFLPPEGGHACRPSTANGVGRRIQLDTPGATASSA